MQSIRRFDGTSSTVGTSTPINASLTWSGDPVDMDSQEGAFSKFRAYAYSSHAGTLNIQQAREDPAHPGTPLASTWSTSKSEPIPAGSAISVEVESLCVRRFVRAQVVNGGTNETTLHVDVALVAV